MPKKTETEARVQLARVLTRGHLRVRLNRNGAVISAENALAIVAAVLVVALIVVLV